MITATLDHGRHGKLPYWDIKKHNGKDLGHATLAVFEMPEFEGQWTLKTRNGLHVHLRYGIHPAELTETKVYDTAVPIGSDHKYPFGGDAITVYESDDLPLGVVDGSIVRSIAARNVEAAIKDSVGG